MKFCGEVAFWEEDKETDPGVWRPAQMVIRKYTGDILRANRRFQSSDQQNDIFTVSNQISILSDLYAQQNWASIRYVVWNGAKLKVSNVELNYPRITLEIGGVYNGTD